MSADSIDQAFVQLFTSEVKIAYQRMGSKLSNTVRRQTNVRGDTAHFQKAGKGTAGTKSRHGDVPTMNINHSRVSVKLYEDYAADYIDKADELKIQHDERAVVAENAAGALGRRADDVLIAAMDAGANATRVAAGGAGLTKAKVTNMRETFDNAEIPDDGQRIWLTTSQGWTDLLDIAEFANADYVGTEDLPWKGGMMAKRFQSFMFMPLSSSTLPVGLGGGSESKNFVYHSPSVGHATAQEITVQMDWIPQKVAHLYNAWMSHGAVVIDAEGVREVDIA